MPWAREESRGDVVGDGGGSGWREGASAGGCEGAKRMTALSDLHSWMALVRLLMRPITGTNLEPAGGRA